VNNGAYLIDKNHDVFLKDLSSVSKVSNVTEAENSHDLLSRNDGVHASTTLNVLGYNLRASLTEPKSKKGSDVYNSPLKNIGLKNNFLFPCLSFSTPPFPFNGRIF